MLTITGTTTDTTIPDITRITDITEAITADMDIIVVGMATMAAIAIMVAGIMPGIGITAVIDMAAMGATVLRAGATSAAVPGHMR